MEENKKELTPEQKAIADSINEAVALKVATAKEEIRAEMEQENLKKNATQLTIEKKFSTDLRKALNEHATGIQLYNDSTVQKAAMDFTPAGALPEEWIPGLFLVPPPDGIILNKADVRDTTFRTLNYNNAVYNATVYKTTGGVAGTDTPGLTLDPASIAIQDFMVIVPVLRSDLEDANFNVGGYVGQAARNAWSRYVDTATFSATGTDPWTSVFAVSGTNAFTMSSYTLQVTSGLLDDFNSAIQSTALQYRTGAEFFFNSSVDLQMYGQKSTIATYVYGAPADATQPGRLWGYPVTQAELLPTVTAATSGTPFGLFTNPKRIIVGRRLAEEARIAYDGTVGTLNLTTSRAVAFIFTYRYGLGYNVPAGITTLSLK